MKRSSILIALSALALSACGGNSVKETLGLERSAPDEFRVVSRPPLSVPPQFSLRPPATYDTTGGDSASRQAQSLVTGKGDTAAPTDTAVMPVKVTNTKRTAKSSASNADSQFLKDAGADQADPRVRESLI